MDASEPTKESNNKNALCKLIEEEQLKCIIMERELEDIEYQLLQPEPLKVRTREEFLRKNIKAPSLHSHSFVPENQKLLEKIAFQILGIEFLKLSVEERSDRLMVYTALCSLSSMPCKFTIQFSCKNLDIPEVDLMKIQIHDSQLADDMQDFITSCINKNSIPLLIKGLSEYSEKVTQITLLLKELDEAYPNSMITTKSNGKFKVDFHDHSTQIKKFTLKLLILFNSNILSFSFGFLIKPETNFAWIHKKHPDLLKEIVESKEMTSILTENLKTLFHLALSN